MDRRHDYLLYAEQWGHALTPAENRQRLYQIRTGENRPARRSSIPGQAPNAGQSMRNVAEGRRDMERVIKRR